MIEAEIVFFGMVIRYALVWILLLASSCSYAQEHSYPVFTSDDAPPFGVYRTADDYLNLRPTDSDIMFKYIPRADGESFYAFFRKGPDGKKGAPLQPKDYFAGSDGEHFYISHGNKWNKARKDDSGYYFTSRSAAGNDENSTLYVRMGRDYKPDAIGVPIGKKKDYKFVYSVLEKKWIMVRR